MIITHVLSGLDPKSGGPPVALEGLSIAQARLGHQIRVVSTFLQGDDLSRVQRLQDAGIQVKMLGPTWGPLRWVRGMRREMHAALRDSDIVHIHSLWEQVQHEAARAARRLDKPYLVRPCGMLDPWSLAQSRWRKKLMLDWRIRRDLSAADAIHYTADAEAELAQPLGLQAPVLVVANGVELDPFVSTTPNPDFFDQRFPNLIGRPKVVFLSRLHPKKGADILLDAFASLLKKYPTEPPPPPALILVGPDQDATQLDLVRQAETLGITDDVAFAGLLNGQDKIHALQNAHVFVLPSHQENFGIAVVEALAAGTPVVISDQVNIHEAIVDACLGHSLPLDENRVPAFAEAMHLWLNDQAQRDRVADAAMPWLRSQYSWDSLAKQWVDVHYPAIRENHAKR